MRAKNSHSYMGNVYKLRVLALPQKKTIVHQSKETGADRREGEISVP